MRYLKKLILRLIKSAGFNLYKIVDKDKYYNQWHILKDDALSVKTVIDIGVGYGTYDLYENANFDYLVLIEPLGIYENEINNILSEINCEWQQVAVSKSKGTDNMIYYEEFPEKTSTQKRIDDFERKGDKKKISVETNTLNNIVEGISISEPIGIKIDAEGSELNILKGSKSVLKYTKYVIAEVPIVQRFKEGYNMKEITEFMNKNGFYIKDIVDIDTGNIVKFADFLFFNSKYD